MLIGMPLSTKPKSSACRLALPNAYIIRNLLQLRCLRRSSAKRTPRVSRLDSLNGCRKAHDSPVRTHLPGCAVLLSERRLE